ncbi:hypothetical protein C8T65DRAFT_45188 [Cerioporus squamosus]|nr:hypothetical protein C8T65DRAFT_45188 [Cerioporus squamosus]
MWHPYCILEARSGTMLRLFFTDSSWIRRRTSSSPGAHDYLALPTRSASMTSASSYIPVEVESVLGSTLVGTFVGLVISGVTAQQTYRYFREYPADSMSLKVFVTGLLITDTLYSVELMHLCYHFLITGHGAPTALAVTVWSISLLPATMGLLVVLVQGFYTLRLYRFKPNFIPVVAFSAIILLAIMALTIGSSIESSQRESFSRITRYASVDIVLISMMLLGDLTLTLTFVLVLHRSRTGLKRSNFILDRLILYAVIATSLISLGTIPGVILVTVHPLQFYYWAMFIATTKLYPPFALAFLNCRKALAEHGIGVGASTAFADIERGTSFYQEQISTVSPVIIIGPPSRTPTEGSEEMEETHEKLA